MMASSTKIYFLIIVLAVLYTATSPAQICINKYASIRYRGSTYDTFTHSIVTPKNEIVSTGRFYDYNSAGHIAKFSEKGAPIWSYQYSLDFYDVIKGIYFKAVTISDIANTNDGGFIIAGNVEQVLSPFGLPPPVKKWGLMAKIDGFGKVVWTKTLSNTGEFNFSNIYQTADGDFIAYLSADNGKKKGPGDHSYGRVLRVDANGKIKWSTFLFTYLFDAGGLGVSNKRGITQAKNNNIIIADVVHETLPTGTIKGGNLHFLEMDYNTGKVSWETSYEYPAPANDTVYLPDIVNATELPNGKFSFITTLYLPGASSNSLVKKGVNIITSNKGAIEKVVAYVPVDGNALEITGAAMDKNNGTRTLLINKGGKAMLANIDNDGQLIWEHGYNDVAGEFPVNCFSSGKNGYNIFTSNNHSLETRLIITDPAGAVDCVNEAADIIAIPAVLNYNHDGVVTNPEIHLDDYYDDAYPLKRGDEYTLTKNIDCQQSLACCTDVIDSNIHQVVICEGKNFMLPDSSLIKDSGTYYVTYKTFLGCDSTVYYHMSLDKEVSKLTVGNDTCLNGQQAITLKATEGFEKYYWMNSPLSGGAAFPVTEPGKYFVRVENVCGSKTDSIEIFDECNYPLEMPTAFSPNNDGKNDYFRIPPRNKNQLIIFNIYNRPGQLVFQTRNRGVGWDGTYKNEPLSADTYVWYIEMIGLSGNRITRKGYVVLIR